MWILICDPRPGVQVIVNDEKVDVVNVSDGLLKIEVDMNFVRKIAPGESWSMTLAEAEKHHSIGAENAQRREVLWAILNPRLQR